MGSIVNVSKSLTNEQILQLSNILINETPVGAIDGVNKVFTVLNPFQPGSTILDRNGIHQELLTEYTESGLSQITFTFAPQVGDQLFIQYKLQP
jgi:hypothetical protein